MIKKLGALLLLLSLSPAFALEETFVLFDKQADRYYFVNKAQAEIRHSPCSTFKVPHALFALEAGVIPNKNQTVKYDPKKYPKQKMWPKAWDRDHDLESAMKHSVVWYFQEIAEKLGEDKEAKYLKELNYGNRDISGGLTKFWLETSLKVSPKEQVDIWKKIFNYQTSFEPKHVDTVKSTILWESTPKFTSWAKTGTCLGKGGISEAWLVGLVRANNKDYYFATYLRGKDMKALQKVRHQKTITFLKRFGAIPAN